MNDLLVRLSSSDFLHYVVAIKYLHTRLCQDNEEDEYGICRVDYVDRDWG